MGAALVECEICKYKGTGCIGCFPDDTVAFYDSEEAFLRDMAENADAYGKLEEAFQIAEAAIETIETLMRDLQKKVKSLE